MFQNFICRRLPALHPKSDDNGTTLLRRACMEAFDPTPPVWAQAAVHAKAFNCPACRSASKVAQSVWINRRAPVYTEDRRRKWQEFYHCECGQAWWAWSSDRPPSELAKPERELPPPRFVDPFED